MMMTSDYTSVKNLQNFGKSRNTNLLILTGISGSGKTTTADRMAEYYDNVEVIHLDAYFGEMDEKHKSKGFDRYLKCHPYPNDHFLDDFPEAILESAINYSKQTWPIKRVIVEGVHWLDPLVEHSIYGIYKCIKVNQVSIVVCQISVAEANKRSNNMDRPQMRYWQRIWRAAIPRLLEE